MSNWASIPATGSAVTETRMSYTLCQNILEIDVRSFEQQIDTRMAKRGGKNKIQCQSHRPALNLIERKTLTHQFIVMFDIDSYIVA